MTQTPTKLTMVSVRMGGRTVTKFVRLPVIDGKVRVDYDKHFDLRRGQCVGLGR